MSRITQTSENQDRLGVRRFLSLCVSHSLSLRPARFSSLYQLVSFPPLCITFLCFKDSAPSWLLLYKACSSLLGPFMALSYLIASLYRFLLHQRSSGTSFSSTPSKDGIGRALLILLHQLTDWPVSGLTILGSKPTPYTASPSH